MEAHDILLADHAMEDDRDLILVNDRLNFVQSGETSAHSELTNDLTSYLNLVLAGYYATLGSNKKKPSVQSAIKKVLKVLDLNFAGAKDLLTVTPEDVARTIDDSVVLDHQGICWQDWDTRGVFLELRQKDLRNFYDVRKSHVNSRHNVNRHPQYCNSYFQFKSYFRCTQPYLVHFQLRNLMLAVDKSSVIVSDYNRAAASFEVRRLNPETGEVLVLMDQEKLHNSFNSDIKISTLAADRQLVIAGSYTGDCLIYNNDSGSIYQDVLTTDDNGITNYIKICKPSSKVYFASNDCHLREFHLDSARIVSHKFPFAINCLAVCPTNPSLQLLVGDCSDSYIMDSRVSVTRPINKFQTHYDYSFCCDWSGYCDSLIATGNQDGTAVVHDLRRPQLEFQCFASYQGHLNDNNNSIRNLKFSKQRNFLCFSETIDNVNIVNLHDNSGQNIGTFGKVSGLSLTSSDNDNGEILTVGISDNSVGGILQYGFDSPGKCLDFDFY